MADECDQAQAIEELNLSQALKNAGVGEFKLTPGTPGDCEECGDHSVRLVQGMCAPCRETDDRVKKLRSMS